jgi:hypothetical protein
MSNYSSALVFLESLAGYVICVLVALFGFLVFWAIATGRIDLAGLLSEKNVDGRFIASMSRFQLLIFVFVIALSFFLVVVANIKILQLRPDANHLPQLPDVPRGVLGLLGISASSYAVSKAIQHGTGTSGNGDGAGARAAEARGPAEPPARQI